VPVGGAASNWRTDPVIAGGGILMDHGWHAIYLALNWFGEAPLSVDADVKWPASGGVEDEVSLAIQFPSGDARIHLTWRGAGRRNAATLIGTAGEIVADDAILRVRAKESRDEPMAAALSAGSHHADWFTSMLPDVLECFRNPLKSRPLFEEAAACLTIIEQVYRAAATA
jgi:predicted dehydrogenase